ncbi:MAG: extracellular solute-binding protein [Acidimicrobiales bacterium]|nr:extracellular solute-binding protein [Acidimicrobiales bacterium]
MTLRVALVGGPMYDDLYRRFTESSDHDVEVVVHADHPTLNREVAERLTAGERLDVISTHGKYAPSQARWLRPLDELVDDEVLAPLAPRSVDLCRFRGDLLCLPRNIDVRVLWWRTDLLERPPASWDDVLAAPGAFGFTGRESGLFGLFYELMVASGATPFDADGRPTLTGAPAVAAVECLRTMASQGPDDLPDWHYDEVDDALLDGRIAMAAAWPGGYERIRTSDRYETLRPAAYPGDKSYSGCHGWAIPRTCGDVDAAVALLTDLAGQEAQSIDAAAGTIPAHRAALDAYVPVDDVDAERLAVTRSTIEVAMLTYPPLECFLEIEDAAWGAIHDALVGTIDAPTAVDRMQAAAVAALEAAS